jgi:cell division protein FtsW
MVMLSIQVVVNIGVSIGALPTKGLPLPFISYGGSALIFNMIAVGLLLNVSRTQDISG